MVANASISHDSAHGRMLPLDGIRGIAVLLVVMHHLAQSVMYEFKYSHLLLQVVQIGWCGVELFFVLSGFLITGILYDSKESPRYFRNFYSRRALRIFPLYYSALIVVFLMRSAWPAAGIYGDASQGWLWIYATNVIISVEGFGSFGTLDHFWSLAIEEHFYLVWPMVVLALGRKQLLGVTAAIFAIAAVSRVIAVYVGVSPDAVYTLTPLRMDSLAAGAWLALMARGPGGLNRLAVPASMLAVVASLLIASIVELRGTTSHDDPLMQVAGYSLFALLFMSIIVLALTFRPLQAVCSLGVLRWFGKYSYGMYVWHPLIFILVLHTDFSRAFRANDDALDQVTFVGMAVVIALVVTILSWQCWEKQFLKLKVKFEA